jgi:hypothetical protein
VVFSAVEEQVQKQVAAVVELVEGFVLLVL